MSAKDIRNIVLLGHGGRGKTTLAESMLFMTGGTDRFGKVTDGNTTCDYDAEEIKRNISISLAVAPVKYKNVKINVLDTPGNFDFAGEVLSGIRAAECAVLVCGAKDGLSVGAERAWKMLGNKPRMIFINRTDEENSDYNACFDALKGKFGTALAPISGQFGAHYGVLAGLLHAAVVLATAAPCGGYNLYNNGFAAGLVALVMVSMIQGVSKRWRSAD